MGEALNHPYFNNLNKETVGTIPLPLPFSHAAASLSQFRGLEARTRADKEACSPTRGTGLVGSVAHEKRGAFRIEVLPVVSIQRHCSRPPFAFAVVSRLLNC